MPYCLLPSFMLTPAVSGLSGSVSIIVEQFVSSVSSHPPKPHQRKLQTHSPPTQAQTTIASLLYSSLPLSSSPLPPLLDWSSPFPSLPFLRFTFDREHPPGARLIFPTLRVHGISPPKVTRLFPSRVFPFSSSSQLEALSVACGLPLNPNIQRANCADMRFL